jgi:hypothetical protein
MPSFVTLAVTALAVFIALGLMSFWKTRRAQSSEVEGALLRRPENIRLVQLSENVRVQVFRRPGGSFGYYYVHRSQSQSGEPVWIAPPNMGKGSVFESAERAEDDARRNSASAI